MKKVILFFAFLFVSTTVFSQTLVKPENFDLSKISTFLQSKGYTILEQNEDFIKIKNKENSTLFIDKDESKKYLAFSINILLKNDTTRMKIDKLLEEINALKMIKATYTANDNSIKFLYDFWITNGFTNETLEDAIMEFFLYQGDSYGLDKDKIFDYE